MIIEKLSAFEEIVVIVRRKYASVGNLILREFRFAFRSRICLFRILRTDKFYSNSNDMYVIPESHKVIMRRY